MMKHSVCLMSYLKLKTQPCVCILVFTGWNQSDSRYRGLDEEDRMVDASSNHFIYFIRSTISDTTYLSAVTCMPINNLPVRKAYTLDENRLTNA